MRPCLTHVLGWSKKHHADYVCETYWLGEGFWLMVSSIFVENFCFYFGFLEHIFSCSNHSVLGCKCFFYITWHFCSGFQQTFSWLWSILASLLKFERLPCNNNDVIAACWFLFQNILNLKALKRIGFSSGFESSHSCTLVLI